jgi:hypothetical protein
VFANVTVPKSLRAALAVQGTNMRVLVRCPGFCKGGLGLCGPWWHASTRFSSLNWGDPST